MPSRKVEPYRKALTGYIKKIREATDLETYRQALSSMLKIGLVAVNAPGGIIMKYNSETQYSTVIAEAFSFRAAGLDENSDVGNQYDETEFPSALKWITGDSHAPLLFDRINLDKKSPEYKEFVEFGLHNALYLAMKDGDKFIGYVEVWESRYHRPFEPDDITILQGVTEFIAQAVIARDPDSLTE